MSRLFVVGSDPRFRGHASIVDVRALDVIDALGFEKLLGFLREHREAWADNVGRQAVIHGGSYSGAVVLGLFALVAPSYPMRIFTSDTEAFDWCGVVDLQAPIARWRAPASGEESLPFRVRAKMRTLAGAAKLDAVAQQLGMSARSLQRGLEDLGTSFREERLAVILAETERMLEGTDLSVDAIAAQLGVRSTSHLREAFRKKHGVSPAAWRDAPGQAKR